MRYRDRARAIDAGARTVLVVVMLLWSTGLIGAQPAAPPAREAAAQETFSLEPEVLMEDFKAGLASAATRLPIAALLGTALALRPRRAGSPPRDPAVIETQIILAIVGALIMIVVGQSLARAFGIAGAANLIRYRAKIEDPKDAVVMLSTLSVGLAAGVGLYGIALVATVFLVITLFVIEGFETRLRTFLLTVKLGEGTPRRRADVERIIKRTGALFELRGTADDELLYLITAGDSLKTEELTAALTALAPEGKAHVEWKEEKKARPLAEKDEEDR